MAEDPTITVLICARNASRHLEKAIPAALNQDYPRHRFHVMVVDNGSTDGTAETAKRLGAIVKPFPRPGVVFARQYSWKIAKSELIAWLDADCEPPRDWLRRLAHQLKHHPELGAVGVRLVGGLPKTLAEKHIMEAKILDTDRFWTRNALQWPFVVTAGMMARRTALAEINGFDLRMGTSTGEDADLCWSLERAGWKVEYNRSVEIIHHHRSSIMAMMKQAHWYGRGSAETFAKWKKELGWWRFTDWTPYRRLAWGLLAAIPALCFAGDRYERWKPTLEVLDSLAFLTGKWRNSLKKRQFFF